MITAQHSLRVRTKRLYSWYEVHFSTNLFWLSSMLVNYDWFCFQIECWCRTHWPNWDVVDNLSLQSWSLLCLNGLSNVTCLKSLNMALASYSSHIREDILQGYALPLCHSISRSRITLWSSWELTRCLNSSFKHWTLQPHWRIHFNLSSMARFQTVFWSW